MRLFRRIRLPGLLFAGLLALAAQAAELTVSAAASLTQALREIAPLFEAASPGTRLQLNFGASGALLAQIARGAPADVFFSADQETMDQAQARGLLRAGHRRDVVSNSLVVIVPATARRPPALLQDLTQPDFARIAIGLPASVPMGRYTKGALESAGLWSLIEPKTVGAQVPRQALDYVARGEVDAGFVYATDAAGLPGKVRVAFTVPTTVPIRYPVATLAAAPNPAAATKFVDFLFTPQAQAVFARQGFGKP
ncbi:MAG: molybdate ABC transporter substrate-binding protein [Burkholderiales bacterium]|nr:molybdate ABC transporter substrate-binding protein [Burkholderiales bacterium]